VSTIHRRWASSTAIAIRKAGRSSGFLTPKGSARSARTAMGPAAHRARPRGPCAGGRASGMGITTREPKVLCRQ
jgi:hypothetical protein